MTHIDGAVRRIHVFIMAKLILFKSIMHELSYLTAVS